MAIKQAPTPVTTTTGPRGESRPRAWAITFTLVILYIINTSDKAVLGLVAQPLREEYGLTASQLGLVGSAFFLAFTISGFSAGLLARWAPLRWLLAFLALAWAACMVPVIAAASFAVLLVSRIVLGATEGPSSALIHTALYSWHPKEKRGLPGAFITSGGSIAKLAVLPAIALVVNQWGWRAGFVTLAVGGVLWVVLWLLVWKEGPYGRDAASAASDSATGDHVPWKTIFTTPTFIAGAVSLIAMYALFTAVLTWLPSYFEVGLGYSRLSSGVMFALPSIVSLITLLLSTFVGDRILARGGSARIFRGILPAAALLVCGLSMVGLPYISTPAIAVALVSVGYGLGSINFPIINAAISQIAPPRQVAGALGLLLAIMAIGGLVAPYLTGYIVDHSATAADGYASAFQIFGIAAVVAAIGGLIFLDPDRDARRVREAATSR
ncbi:MFS transporter [Granulicoccus phenolivorans]|uniref:MFS transporter n=1 Tax=Granulicoccus phenolivorans TaxID=266854 RepID=UPI000401B7A2|nr:MFS transporter [Granulicoccus phenolivorans]